VAIKRQLLEADLPSTEKTVLINFIDSITQEPKIKRIGEEHGGYVPDGEGLLLRPTNQRLQFHQGCFP
ncbi:MAG: hypothetical protein EBX50_21150, partial [Chitinophagia bacterium]|nr:hypothetical protein [Chitinophagia bacterium]